MFELQIIPFRYSIAFQTSVVMVIMVLKVFELSNLSLSENIGGSLNILNIFFTGLLLSALIVFDVRI